MPKFLKVDVTMEIPDGVEYDSVIDKMIEAVEELGCEMGGGFIPVDENGDEIQVTV